jgi:hypothetical protein
MVSPQHKQRAVEGVVKTGLCSQRRACRYLGLHRSSSRYERKAPTDWLLRLHQEVEALSRQHPRLGYRKLTRLVRAQGWQVGRKLVQRIRRECGLRVKRWRPPATPTGTFHGQYPHAGRAAQSRLELGLRSRPHRQWRAAAHPLPHRRVQPGMPRASCRTEINRARSRRSHGTAGGRARCAGAHPQRQRQ